MIRHLPVLPGPFVVTKATTEALAPPYPVHASLPVIVRREKHAPTDNVSNLRRLSIAAKKKVALLAKVASANSNCLGPVPRLAMGIVIVHKDSIAFLENAQMTRRSRVRPIVVRKPDVQQDSFATIRMAGLIVVHKRSASPPVIVPKEKIAAMVVAHLPAHPCTVVAKRVVPADRPAKTRRVHGGRAKRAIPANQHVIASKERIALMDNVLVSTRPCIAAARHLVHQVRHALTAKDNADSVPRQRVKRLVIVTFRVSLASMAGA